MRAERTLIELICTRNDRIKTAVTKTLRHNVPGNDLVTSTVVRGSGSEKQRNKARKYPGNADVDM
ncbi:hypothetical protein E4U09_000739 [Claviceps aff. purpurea]|uniref:Uncharacterized protein n=1 Tax=Claviceps aff. purpurea TaxID=1967640 RepID=A0A9P7QKD6_9HYPO|nr:hypothetical protein E4U09_000739 [Claviceps aff. purpurea]